MSPDTLIHNASTVTDNDSCSTCISLQNTSPNMLIYNAITVTDNDSCITCILLQNMTVVLLVLHYKIRHQIH